MNLVTLKKGNLASAICKYLLDNYLKLASIEELQVFLNKKYNANLAIDGEIGTQTYFYLYKELCNPQSPNIVFNGFYAQKFPKKQIVLHHTAGWDNAEGVFQWWQVDQQWHVATAIAISDTGKLIRGFDEDYWAHHIGMSNAFNTPRNTESVAVEICNWGCLEERNGEYFTYINNFGKTGKPITIPKERVIALDYKGFKFYEAYTDAEIAKVKIWILLMAMKYEIPLDYSHKDVFPKQGETSNRAIQGDAGIYSHNSFIDWKTDISPQPKMIEMLKEIAQIGKPIQVATTAEPKVKKEVKT
jgi:hypothetical protein